MNALKHALFIIHMHITATASSTEGTKAIDHLASILFHCLLKGELNREVVCDWNSNGIEQVKRRSVMLLWHTLTMPFPCLRWGCHRELISYNVV